MSAASYDMDKTLILEKEAVEDKGTPNDTGGYVQTDDVEMVEMKTDSHGGTAPDEELAEKSRPHCIPQNKDAICTTCGFIAKCPRYLKVHYARKHGKKSKNNTRATEKPAEKSANVSVSQFENQKIDMEGDSTVEAKQIQLSATGPELDELRSTAKGDAITTEPDKERAFEKQQPDQEERILTQERRISKRIPKPKMIYSCDYCGQEFRDKPPLDVHIQRHHTKDTPYSCEYLPCPDQPSNNALSTDLYESVTFP